MQAEQLEAWLFRRMSRGWERGCTGRRQRLLELLWTLVETAVAESRHPGAATRDVLTSVAECVLNHDVYWIERAMPTRR